MKDFSVGPTSKSFRSQRLRLHYLDWGNPDAPPLLMIHGHRDNCRSWDTLAARLRPNWHVIALDLRGHGASQWSSDSSYTIANYIYDFATLVDHLGERPVTIVGHSLGGSIALLYSGVYPENVAKVAAIEGIGPSPNAARHALPVGERFRTWIADQRRLTTQGQRRFRSFDEALRRMQQANGGLSPEQARHLTEHSVSRNDDGTCSWTFDNVVRGWQPVEMQRADVHALWQRIACPTLLVYGQRSPGADPAEADRAQLFRNATIAMIEEAGHWAHHDRFEQFWSVLAAFLAAVASVTPAALP